MFYFDSALFQIIFPKKVFYFIYRCISINLNVVEKFIYFCNSTQIVKLVY